MSTLTEKKLLADFETKFVDKKPFKRQLTAGTNKRLSIEQAEELKEWLESAFEELLEGERDFLFEYFQQFLSTEIQKKVLADKRKELSQKKD